MASIRHTLQKEVFDITEEKLVGLLHVTKHGKKKKKISFLCAAINKEKPVYAFIHQVKETDKDSFKKKNSWSLFELQVVDGKDENKETAELDLTLDRVYKWVASSVPEKHFFIQVLWELCCRYLPKQKPLFLNVPAELMREDSDKTEGKVVIASGESYIDSYHSDSTMFNNSNNEVIGSNTRKVMEGRGFKQNDQKVARQIAESIYHNGDKLEVYYNRRVFTDDYESDSSDGLSIDKSSQGGHSKRSSPISIKSTSGDYSSSKDIQTPFSQVVIEQKLVSTRAKEGSSDKSLNESVRSSIGEAKKQETKPYWCPEIVDIVPVSSPELKCDIFLIDSSGSTPHRKHSFKNEGKAIPVIVCDKWDDTSPDVEVSSQEVGEIKMQSDSCSAYIDQMTPVKGERFLQECYDDEWEEEWDTEAKIFDVPMRTGAESVPWNSVPFPKTHKLGYNEGHLLGQNVIEATGINHNKFRGKHSNQNVSLHGGCSLHNQRSKCESSHQREFPCKSKDGEMCCSIEHSHVKPGSHYCCRCTMDGDSSSSIKSNQKMIDDPWNVEDDWLTTMEFTKKDNSHCQVLSAGFQPWEGSEIRHKAKGSPKSIDHKSKADVYLSHKQCHCNTRNFVNECAKVEYGRNFWGDLAVDPEAVVESSQNAGALANSRFAEVGCGQGDSHKPVIAAGALFNNVSNGGINWERMESCSACLHNYGRWAIPHYSQRSRQFVREDHAAVCKKGFPLSSYGRALPTEWDKSEDKNLGKDGHYAVAQDMHGSNRYIDYTVDPVRENWNAMPYEPGYFHEYDVDWEAENDDLYYDWDEGPEWGEENFIPNFEENPTPPPPAPDEEDEWDIFQQMMQVDMLEMRSRWLLKRRYG